MRFRKAVLYVAEIEQNRRNEALSNLSIKDNYELYFDILAQEIYNEKEAAEGTAQKKDHEETKRNQLKKTTAFIPNPPSKWMRAALTGSKKSTSGTLTFLIPSCLRRRIG